MSYYPFASTPDGSPIVTIGGPLSAFGLPPIVEDNPSIHLSWTHGLNSKLTRSIYSTTAPSTSSGNLSLTTGAVAQRFAILRSISAIHYYAGIGGYFRGTASWNSGVANSRQLFGGFAPDAGFGVGYTGTTWGIVHRSGGAQSIYSCTITVGAGGAGNITITLDGTAVVVAIGGALSTTATAWTIAAADYSGCGGTGTWGWDAYALGATVYFISRRAMTTGGAFTFDAGATGAAAGLGMVEVRAGVNEVDNWSSPGTPGTGTWFDTLSGGGGASNPSNLNLDKQKAIIHEGRYGFLGHRGCDFYTIHPSTGRPIRYATFPYMNTSTSNALVNPTLYWWSEVSNLTAASAMTATFGSGVAGLQGNPGDESRLPWSTTFTKIAPNGAPATPHMSIRCAPLLGLGGATPRAARAEVMLESVRITVTGTANQYVDLAFYRNGVTLGNTASFGWVDASTSAIWLDTTAATGTVTGVAFASPRLYTGSSRDIAVRPVRLEAGDLITVTTVGSGANLSVDLDLNGYEVH